MKTLTVKELKSQMKFKVLGSETIYLCESPFIRNGQVTVLNTKFNTNSRLGVNAKIILLNN